MHPKDADETVCPDLSARILIIVMLHRNLEDKSDKVRIDTLQIRLSVLFIFVCVDHLG